jgi:hypothetical protein
MKECPEGHYCPSGTTRFGFDTLWSENNMRACPNGYFCPKGTGDIFHITGNFTTPQVCKDGFICGQSIFYENLTATKGSIS